MMRQNWRLNRQQGAVTLLTAIVLLIAIMSVAIMSGKITSVQTQNTANDQRAAQALAAANAGMDWALAYYDQGGPAQNDSDPYTDNNGDGNPIELDYTASSPNSLTLTNSTSQVYFQINDGACSNSNTSALSALVVATGRSDDGIGLRTIRQCVAGLDVFGGNGPRQPLVTKGGVGLTGNYEIINRFNTTLSL